MRDAGHRTPDAGHRTTDIGHRTAKKAKIIYPPPRGVDIITCETGKIQGKPLDQITHIRLGIMWNLMEKSD